jgi:choline transport protein
MLFVGFQITNWMTFTVNCFERLLPFFSKGILTFTVTSLIVIFVSLIAATRNRASANSVFVTLSNESGWTNGVAFLIGTNGTNWGFSCLDAACHLANEIPTPRRNIPKALLCTVALGALTGLPIILALFFAVSDMGEVALSTVPSLEILYQSFNGNAAGAMGLQCLILISATGAIIGIHTWQSRMAWAFSRDGGFPFSKYMGAISPAPFSAPLWAHTWSSVWISLLGCLVLGSTTALGSFISAGILLQYVTYCLAIAFLLLHGRQKVSHGPFWFSRLGYAANIVTLAWTMVALVFYCFPYSLPVEAGAMNYVSCVMIGIVLYALAYWAFFGRRTFKIPLPEDEF